jgi:AcrR family transcriptional regulator
VQIVVIWRECLAEKGDKRPASGPTKGRRTREEIVARALYTAARDGLGALSIGKLAKELKMSKSSLFVYFGSKENLETAVVERAGVLFFDHVLVPIEEDGLEGIERVWSLCDLWLKFVEDRVFPGGYFFTGPTFSAQVSEVPFPVRLERLHVTGSPPCERQLTGLEGAANST